MSNKGKKGSLTANTALGGIMERLQSLSEHDYIATMGVPGEDDTIVGEMSDYLRRLTTLRSQLASEYNTLVRKVNELGGQIERSQKSGGTELDGLLYMLRGGLSVNTVEELKDRMADLRAKAHEVEFFDSLYWFEVRAAFPELADKTHIGVFSDWRVGWKKVTRSTIDALIESAFEGAPDLPAKLRDMLRPGRALRYGRAHADAE